MIRLWGLIVLDHLQETVENPPDFTDIVVQSPLGADGIELVEEVNASNIVDGVEYLAQFGGCFSHVFCDEGVQSDGKRGMPSSPASTEAVSVLPVPGGPTSSSLRLG